MNNLILHLCLCRATLEVFDASKINGRHRTSPVEAEIQLAMHPAETNFLPPGLQDCYPD